MAFMGSRSARILIGALGLLVLGGWFWPAPVRAQCGHYVIHGASHPESPSTDVGDSAGPSRDPSGVPPQESAPPPLPCSGPNCSRGQPLSVPLQAPSPHPTEEWGWAVLPSQMPDCPGLDRLSEDGSARPVRQGGLIFHPPRLS